MADIFDIVADANRRDILGVLLDAQAADPDGEISVSQIVADLELSQPTVSKHLKVLRDAHLVEVREQGQRRLYRLDTAPLEQVREWLGRFIGPEPEDEPEPEGKADAAALGTAEAATAVPVESDGLDVPEPPKLGPATAELARSLGRALADVRSRIVGVR